MIPTLRIARIAYVITLHLSAFLGIILNVLKYQRHTKFALHNNAYAPTYLTAQLERAIKNVLKKVPPH